MKNACAIFVIQYHTSPKLTVSRIRSLRRSDQILLNMSPSYRNSQPTTLASDIDRPKTLSNYSAHSTHIEEDTVLPFATNVSPRHTTH